MPRVTDPALLSQLNSSIQDQWGPGAAEMPDGSIVRYGPRGALTVLKPATSTDPALLKLTEEQGKAAGQLRMMRDAEAKYQAALRAGYNPTSFLNRAASYVEHIPFVDGLAPTLRPPSGDLGYQAEQQWADAQLRATSGAAATEPEVKRSRETFFPMSGEIPRDIGPIKQSSREQAFESAKSRAGPLGATAGAYRYSPDNPIDLSKGQSRSTIPFGAFYRDPQGNIRRNDNEDRGNPIIRKAPPPIGKPPRVKAGAAAMSDDQIRKALGF